MTSHEELKEAMNEVAYVDIINVRKRHVGYVVRAEYVGKDGMRVGRLLAEYRWDKAKVSGARKCDTWKIALSLANMHRDDFNEGIVE